MARIPGRLLSVGAGVESTRGTSVAPTFWIPDTEFSVMDKNEKAVDASAYGRMESGYDADLVQQWAEGSITGIIYDQLEGVFLKNLFGTVGSVAKGSPNTSVYDHTFTVLNTASH